MVYFQNPENALKRAKEFIEVNKKNDALDTLHEVLRMRRHRQYQHDLHEPIITLYLSLCVELKKGHAAKEGLYQYKILTQNTDINSLEKVSKWMKFGAVPWYHTILKAADYGPIFDKLSLKALFISAIVFEF